MINTEHLEATLKDLGIKYHKAPSLPPVGGFDRPITAEIKGVLFVTAVVTLFFFLFPGPIVAGAEAAAAALFTQ